MDGQRPGLTQDSCYSLASTADATPQDEKVAKVEVHDAGDGKTVEKRKAKRKPGMCRHMCPMHQGARAARLIGKAFRPDLKIKGDG